MLQSLINLGFRIFLTSVIYLYSENNVIKNNYLLWHVLVETKIEQRQIIS
jgi:hypothetical protein